MDRCCFINREDAATVPHRCAIRAENSLLAITTSRWGRSEARPSISTPHNTRRGSTRISSSMSCPVEAGCSPWKTDESDDSSPARKSASYSLAEWRADHDPLVSQIVRPVHAARSVEKPSITLMVNSLMRINERESIANVLGPGLALSRPRSLRRVDIRLDSPNVWKYPKRSK